MDKKFVVLVSGIGDTLLSDNSHRKLKNNKTFLPQVESALKHLTDTKKVYALVNMHYPSESFKDVDVFSECKPSRVVSLKINSKSLMDKANELAIKDIEGEDLLFNGNQFSFIFRPEEYDVYILGIDLHGIFTETIKELLNEGYNVRLFSDCLSSLPPTHKYVATLNKNKNFEFCSFKSV